MIVSQRFSKLHRLRNVTIDDEDLIFCWVTDPVVRSASFSQEAINITTHQKWFRERLCSSDCWIWIYERNRQPCGLVRIERECVQAQLSYMLCYSCRGKNLASIMLKMAVDEFRKTSSLETIFARTRPDNISSQRSLERAGFKLKYQDKSEYLYISVRSRWES